jgi:DNA-binding MarR family transcriptional regulator
MDDTAKTLLGLARLARKLYPRGGIAGLEPAEMQVLIALWDTPGSSVRELATALDLNRSSVSNALKALHELGLVIERAPTSHTDGRRRPQALTRKGRTVAQRFLSQARETLLSEADVSYS